MKLVSFFKDVISIRPVLSKHNAMNSYVMYVLMLKNVLKLALIEFHI